MSMIPNRLHQFWDKKHVPDDLRPLINSWVNKSGYQCQLFDLECARDFIAENFNQTELSAFDKCNIPAMKSDLFRLLITYHHGGWYADCSIECLKSPNHMQKDTTDIELVYYRRWHGGVNNGFFGASPKNKYIQHLLETALHNIKHETSASVFCVTGPKLWNDLFPKGETIRQLCREVSHAEIAGEYVQFHQDLHHKKEGRHWSEQEKEKSIFATD